MEKGKIKNTSPPEMQHEESARATSARATSAKFNTLMVSAWAMLFDPAQAGEAALPKPVPAQKQVGEEAEQGCVAWQRRI